jgi:phage FluMu protein Com
MFKAYTTHRSTPIAKQAPKKSVHALMRDFHARCVKPPHINYVTCWCCSSDYEANPKIETECPNCNEINDPTERSREIAFENAFKQKTQQQLDYEDWTSELL